MRFEQEGGCLCCWFLSGVSRQNEGNVNHELICFMNYICFFSSLCLGPALLRNEGLLVHEIPESHFIHHLLSLGMMVLFHAVHELPAFLIDPGILGYCSLFKPIFFVYRV
jgi:hypothetical protein